MIVLNISNKLEIRDILSIFKIAFHQITFMMGQIFFYYYTGIIMYIIYMWVDNYVHYSITFYSTDFNIY